MLVGLGLGQLVIGPLSDALGRRRPLITGVVAHLFASVLCALAPSIGLLTAARLMQGLAGAAVAVVSMAIVRDLFSGMAAATLLSRLMLVTGIAPVLAPSLGGLVLSGTTWRGVFVVLATAAFVLVWVAVLGLRETLPAHRRRTANPGAILRDLPRPAARPHVRRAGARSPDWRSRRCSPTSPARPSSCRTSTACPRAPTPSSSASTPSAWSSRPRSTRSWSAGSARGRCCAAPSRWRSRPPAPCWPVR